MRLRRRYPQGPARPTLLTDAVSRGLHRALPLEWLLVAVAVVAAALLPPSPLDDALVRAQLTWASSAARADGAALVRLSAKEVRDGSCGEPLAQALSEARADAVVLWAEAGDLCRLEATAPTTLTRPDIAYEGGRPVGLARSVPGLSLESAQWVLSARPEAVPGTFASDLLARRTPPGYLAGQVAVVAVADDERSAREASHVTAILSGVRGGGARSEAPWFARSAALLVVVLAAWAAWKRTGRLAAHFAAGATMIVALFAAPAALLPLLHASLLPSATLVALAIPALVAVVWPELRDRATARRRAVDLAADAAKHAPASVVLSPPSALFADLARFAHTLFPAEVVLAAELPAGRWHLVFHEVDGVGAGHVAEPRRDVRRSPYCDGSGRPRLGVTRGFLVMRDTPVVVVPLEIRGELEGYLFFAGAQAESAHLADPERLARIAAQLAFVARTWRANRHRVAIDEVARSSPTAARARLVQQLVEHASRSDRQVAVASAPTLFADELGRITRLEGGMSAWLERGGVDLPKGTGDGPFAGPPLTLVRAVSVVARVDGDDAARLVALALERLEPVVHSTLGDEGAELTLVALRDSPTLDAPPRGFVLRRSALAASDARTPDATALVAFPARDALGVMSAWDLASRAAEQVTAEAGTLVRIGSVRTDASVIVQRAQLLGALVAFLRHAAATGSSRAPVLTLKAAPSGVTLSIADLDLAVPKAAIARTLDAPGAAPPELESLARLARAVAESQGTIAVKAQTGWGTVVRIVLLRAKVPLAAIDDGSAAAAAPVKRLRSTKK